jgi:hypothetical protein
MRARIDALVARVYGLKPYDLPVLFADFTSGAVPQDYRDLVHAELERLCR